MKKATAPATELSLEWWQFQRPGLIPPPVELLRQGSTIGQGRGKGGRTDDVQQVITQVLRAVGRYGGEALWRRNSVIGLHELCFDGIIKESDTVRVFTQGISFFDDLVLPSGQQPLGNYDVIKLWRRGAKQPAVIVLLLQVAKPHWIQVVLTGSTPDPTKLPPGLTGPAEDHDDADDSG